jgi:alkylation response protein AidB-like acyl-CoA dehydrogenase
MDFNLTPEQLLIKDSVARFAAGEHAEGDPWPTFTELGWLAIGAPDELGGFGGALETLLLMEQFGRGRVVSPYVGGVVFAGTILRAADRLDLLESLVDGSRRFAVAYEEPHARYDPALIATTAAPAGDGFVIDGTKVRVLDAGTADTLIVSARGPQGPLLLTVAATSDGITRTPFASEDGHDVANVSFDGVRVGSDAVLSGPDTAPAVLERGLDHAIGALCAEGLGLMSAMLEMTVAYAKQRQQFGVAIGSFQALQHRMAEMFIELELARSMAFLAATTLDGDGDDATRHRGLSAAKVQIARSGRFVGQQAIQIHGGIGMSEEYKVGHYFKRMTMIERLLGDVDFHLARFASTPVPAEREAVVV